MSERSVQLNIRTTPWVARELRERAQGARLTLGEALEALIETTAPGRGEGVWLSLEPALDEALSAVAAARGHRRDELLSSLLKNEVAGALRRLAEALDGEGAGSDGVEKPVLTGEPPEHRSSSELPDDPSESSLKVEDEAAVGIFTVFD